MIVELGSPASISPVPAMSRMGALVIELGAAEQKLETLRKSEIDLRADLVASLNILAYFAGHAKFRVETRQCANGATGLNAHTKAAQSAERKLAACSAEIERQRRVVTKLCDKIDAATAEARR